MLLPALIFAVHEAVSGDRRILAGCIAVLTTIGIVVSGTRGAWVAAGVGVLLFMVPQLPARRRLPAVAGILILLLAVYQVPGSETLSLNAVEMPSRPVVRVELTFGPLDCTSLVRLR